MSSRGFHDGVVAAEALTCLRSGRLRFQRRLTALRDEVVPQIEGNLKVTSHEREEPVRILFSRISANLFTSHTRVTIGLERKTRSEKRILLASEHLLRKSSRVDSTVTLGEGEDISWLSCCCGVHLEKIWEVIRQDDVEGLSLRDADLFICPRSTRGAIGTRARN